MEPLFDRNRLTTNQQALLRVFFTSPAPLLSYGDIKDALDKNDKWFGAAEVMKELLNFACDSLMYSVGAYYTLSPQGAALAFKVFDTDLIYEQEVKDDD
jgi:hypothetical protein